MSVPILSLVVPVLNEAESIELFIESVRPHVQIALSQMGAGAEVEYVFIDDGSTDGTCAVIRALHERDQSIRLVKLSRNFGKEAALAAGLDYAAGDAVIPMDVDLQDPPELIPQLTQAWLAGADVVNAKRIDRSGDTSLKRLVANSFYRTFNMISSEKLPENVGDFRLLSWRAVDVLRTLPERARMNKALFSWIGFETVTLEYKRPSRRTGTSSWSTLRLWGLAIDGITASTTAPLRVWSVLGVMFAAAAILFAAFLGLRTIFFGVEVPGYASLMTAVLMLGGLQLTSLGVMGEYVGRIAKEVRGRPLYVVEATYGVDALGNRSHGRPLATRPQRFPHAHERSDGSTFRNVHR